MNVLFSLTDAAETGNIDIKFFYYFLLNLIAIIFWHIYTRTIRYFFNAKDELPHILSIKCTDFLDFCTFCQSFYYEADTACGSYEYPR